MRVRKALAGFLALILAGVGVVVGATAASAEDPAVLGITKTTSPEVVSPGDTVQFTINVSCTYSGANPAAGCTNATMTDVIPDGLTPTSVTATYQGSNPPQQQYVGDITGQEVSVDFTTPLADPAGSVGMLQGTTAEIVITCTVDDLPYAADGIPLVNEAEFSATNPETDDVTDTATVTPEVPLVLTSDVEKSFTPASALAVPGTETVASIVATNTSDEGADQMVIQDPADPTASPNPFDSLQLTSLDINSFPPNADQVQIEIYEDGAWTTVDDLPADTSGITGIRLTFTSSTGELIEPGAEADIDLGFEQRDLGALDQDVVVDNTVTNEVERDDVVGPSDDDAAYTILGNIPDVSADKDVTPLYGPHGSEFNAELVGENTWTDDLASLSLTEPADGTPGFDDSMSFEGFAEPFDWPAGATGGTITYECSGTDAAPQDLDAAPALPPGPPAGCDVTRFTIDFTGTIPPGATATFNVTLGTDPDDPAQATQHDNTVGVTGTSPSGATGDDEADDTFYTYLAVIDALQSKDIVPGTIIGNAGEWIVATLPGGTAPAPGGLPLPDDYSTVPSHEIVIQDPPATSLDDDTPLDSDFWDTFSPTELADIAIPAGATLTVNYWDPVAEEWVQLPGPDFPIEGPTTWSWPGPFPDDVGGFQFIFESEQGFPPGTTLQPNIVLELDEDVIGTDPITVDNCANTAATADNADPDLSEPGCDSITILPIDPDGGGDGAGGTGEYVDKDILEPTINARTEDEVTARLLWSTGGVSGMDSLTLSDVPAPSAAPADLAQSFFDAFDLVAIEAITPATDPLIQWDAVASVELYRVGVGWVEAENSPCPGGCDGQLPRIPLTPEEQADTIGVRIQFVEGSARADSTDPTAPPVGSGVARSIDDERPVDLTFRIRDERRSDGSPVTGHSLYNEPPDEGLIRDDVSATAEVGDETFVDDGSDVIDILDVPLVTDITKDWTGGPLGDPPLGTDPDDYPSGRVTLTALNQTQARIDSMVVADPGDTGLNPYDYFTLTDIVSMQVPSGTESWTATLDVDSDGDGVADTTTVVTSTPGDPQDPGPLTSLTAGELEDVVGITVDYEGRIDPNASAVIVFDLQLRELNRSDGTDIEPPFGGEIDVANGADVTIDDAGRDPELQPDPITDDDGAVIQIVDLDLDLTVDKQFGPLPAGSEWTTDGFSQTEPDQSEFGMLLSVTPSGSARTGEIEVRDIDPTFWNAYEFVRFDESFTFTDPIDQVQVDVLVGGDFTDTGSDVDPGTQVWIPGEPSDFPTLPAEITDPSEIQGLRITYSRADGDQWENSEMPTQEIPIVVQRRDELLTGGEVPTDMAGNEPAPGEVDPGRSTNTIDGIARSYLTDSSGGNPLFTVQAEDDTASVLYEHATTAVAVEKNPSGTIPPGAVTDFTLTITNTGDWPIIDPVITDRLPTDADGPMLQLEPGNDDPYAYDLAGGAPDPANGLPMPEDSADVTETVSGDGSEIVFTFPPGTVLEPGQTYTITVSLYPRPGVAAGVDMTNSFGVVGERPFDECDGTLDEDTGECIADTTVDLAIAGAIRSGKVVKADEGSLGVEPVSDDIDCTPGEDGFYPVGCVPITAPGETETWRLQLQNTGTVPLDRLIAIDLLPTPGDTGAINPVDRLSEWTPILEDAVVGADGPPGTLTVYGTTDAAPCTDDLTPSTPCPAGAWTPIDEIADLSTVTALKYDVTFDEGFALEPGETVTVDFRTRTPAQSETAGPDTIAWNTVATGAVTSDGNELLPIEGNKVGVALATGPLELLKLVDGDGAAFAPDEVTVTVQCTSVGELVYDEEVTLPVGEVVTIEDLPYGSECTVTETDAGQTSQLPIGSAVVGRPDETPIGRVTVTNIYDLAGLDVTKSVDSEAVDQDGEPIVYGRYFVYVRCEFLGEQVWGSGYGPLMPMVGILDDGDTFSVDGLPAGAECTVTELLRSGAADVTLDITPGGAATTVVDGNVGTIELAPDGVGDGNSVLVTNRYDVGSLAIDKVVTGAGADIIEETFEFSVECTLTVNGRQVVTWNGDVTIDYPAEDSVTIENIASGSVCVVTETDDGNADTVDVQPANGEDGSATVTIGVDDEVTVTATNGFDVGTLAIRKRITGAGHDFAPDAFDVAVVCTVDDEVVFEGEYTLDQGNGYSVSITDEIPYGAECVVTEEDAGQTSSTIVPGTAVIGEDPEVFVTNVYELASLDVTKAVDSDALDADGDVPDYGPFTVTVECTFLDEAVYGAGYGPGQPMIGQVSAGETWTIDGLPAGAECVVTEVDDAGAADTLVVATAGDLSATTYSTTGQVDLVPGDENSVTFTNRFEAGTLVIEKTVTGPGADDLGGGPFTFSVLCTLEQPGGELVTWDGDVVLGGDLPLTATIDTIAAGSECVVTETDSGGADDVLVLPGRDDPESATVTVDAGAQVTVTARNWFAAPPSTGVLGETGFGGWAALAAAGVLVVAGGVLLLVRRRG
ncbi:DUF5979 domain-containing protein [Demequina phytophila]|uniref:DUF5979 domain-containing protein n=1 Tax=Demequina phytophila TaxID=1638981 RepID=UPI0007864D7B|nr:DUF5979 domain-containing protein [Demequina phytophila]